MGTGLSSWSEDFLQRSSVCVLAPGVIPFHTYPVFCQQKVKLTVHDAASSIVVLQIVFVESIFPSNVHLLETFSSGQMYRSLLIHMIESDELSMLITGHGNLLDSWLDLHA